MKVMLDTNICIYMIKQNPPEVVEKFEQYSVSDIGLSSITVAELQYGVQKSKFQEQNQTALQQFLAPLVVANFDEAAALTYGKIRAELEARGRLLGALDMLIAAHALHLEVELITNDIKGFSSIPALRFNNWVDG